MSIDQRIAGLASGQRGVVARRQLLAAGIDADSIKHRLRTARLHSIHRGVYLVGHSVPAHGARELAALLACGAGAVVSHRTAGNLWRLLPHPRRGPVEITIVGRERARRAGIQVRCVAALHDRDTTTIEGIPATTPARTLLDLAAVLPPHLLERAIADAQARRLARHRDLVDQLDRNDGRRGTRVLRRLLDLDGGPALTRSEAERRLLKLIRAAGLPAPEVNARIGDYEVDFVWREQRLVVEVDGFRYHSSRAAFERDRERDAALAAIGYTVLRLTWRRLVEAPHAVIARLATALAARG